MPSSQRHTADMDNTRLSCLVLSVSAVWTELETSQDCRRQKISRLNMFNFFCIFVLSPNAGLDRQNCSVSDILRTTENCLGLSPIQFTPPTQTRRQDNLVASVSAVWTGHNSVNSRWMFAVANDEHDHHWSDAATGDLRTAVHSRLWQRQKKNVGQSPTAIQWVFDLTLNLCILY